MYTETAYAFETVTVPSGNVAAALTRTKYDLQQGLPCKKVLITVSSAVSVSYSLISGVTVGSATGHQLNAYGVLIIEDLGAIKNFQTTSVSSGTTGLISVTYFR